MERRRSDRDSDWIGKGKPGRNIRHSPLPTSEHQLLSRLTQILGSRSEALAISWEDALLTLAIADFEDTVQALQSSVSELRGCAPDPNAQGENSGQQLLEWELDFELAQARAIEEDCCFNLPLDHPFGESFVERDSEHWLDFPRWSAEQEKKAAGRVKPGPSEEQEVSGGG